MDTDSQNKYNPTLAVLLCVYFVLLVRTLIGAIPMLFHSIIPDILRQSNPSGWALFYLVYFLGVFYGFWAIVLALKSSKTAIPALKLALPFSFFSFVFSILPKLSVVSYLTLAIIIFYIGFFIYLCKSDRIEEDFPKYERRLGTPGTIGVALYSIILILFVGTISYRIAQDRSGRNVDPSTLTLKPGEISDGRTVFTPKPEWIQDSTATIEDFRNMYYYHDKDSSKIAIFSCQEEYEPTRDTYIYSIYEDQPLDVDFYQDEIAHKTFETQDDIIYIDQYRYKKDSTSFYWTYASKLNGKLMKGIRLSILEKDSLRTSITDMEQILHNCLLSTKERSLKNQRINQENNPDKYDKDGYPPPGTGQEIHEPAE